MLYGKKVSNFFQHKLTEHCIFKNYFQSKALFDVFAIRHFMFWALQKELTKLLVLHMTNDSIFLHRKIIIVVDRGDCHRVLKNFNKTQDHGSLH